MGRFWKRTAAAALAGFGLTAMIAATPSDATILHGGGGGWGYHGAGMYHAGAMYRPGWVGAYRPVGPYHWRPGWPCRWGYCGPGWGWGWGYAGWGGWPWWDVAVAPPVVYVVDDSCFVYRRVWSASGRYLGVRLVNLCAY